MQDQPRDIHNQHKKGRHAPTSGTTLICLPSSPTRFSERSAIRNELDQPWPGTAVGESTAPDTPRLQVHSHVRTRTRVTQ